MSVLVSVGAVVSKQSQGYACVKFFQMNIFNAYRQIRTLYT